MKDNHTPGEVKIKPCPFNTKRCSEPWVEGPDFGDYWVACGCSATGPSTGTELEAIELWNREIKEQSNELPRTDSTSK